MSQIPTADELKTLAELAKVIKKTSKFKNPKKDDASVEDILVALIMARELGLPLMAAATGGINVVYGSIELGAHTMAAKIREAGHIIDIQKSTREECVIRGKRKDGAEHTVSFTAEDAKRAGLISDYVPKDPSEIWKEKKKPWNAYRDTMLYCRCISKLCRALFSDVFGIPVYATGEISESRDQEPEKIDTSLLFSDQEKDTKIESKDSNAEDELDMMIHTLYDLFPGQDENFAAFVIDKAEKARMSLEKMYNALYKNIQLVPQKFLDWKSEKEMAI